MSACRQFARWAIKESCFCGFPLDDADVQEKALALGLIVDREYLDGMPYCEFSGELAEPSFTPHPAIFPAEWIDLE